MAPSTHNLSSRSKPGTVPLNSVTELMCLFVTGQPDAVKNTSGRIVSFTSYMTSLVLMAAYSAFLISSLAVQHQVLPFRDFQGLLRDGSYRLGVMRDSSHFDNFRVCRRNYFWPNYFI